MPKEVEGLKFAKIEKSIRWRGKVRLHMLGEDDESLIGEHEWPPKSDKVYFACATTGLLFDQATGRCLQSQNVELLLDTLVPASPKDLAKHVADRRKLDTGRHSKHLIVEV